VQAQSKAVLDHGMPMLTGGVTDGAVGRTTLDSGPRPTVAVRACLRRDSCASCVSVPCRAVSSCLTLGYFCRLAVSVGRGRGGASSTSQARPSPLTCLVPAYYGSCHACKVSPPLLERLTVVTTLPIPTSSTAARRRLVNLAPSNILNMEVYPGDIQLIDR
jgi:hypothetical protein